MDWIGDVLPAMQKLSPPLKVVATAVVLTLATFAVALIWQPSPNSTNGGVGWTKSKTLESLRYTLERTSPQNRKILLEILNAGRNGIYDFDVSKALSISEGEVSYRAKDLASVGLIEIVPLTRPQFRLHDDVYTAIGPTGADLLRTLLT